MAKNTKKEASKALTESFAEIKKAMDSKEPAKAVKKTAEDVKAVKETVKEAPKALKETAKAVKEAPKALGETAKAVKEAPKALEEAAKAVKEVPKAVKEVPKAVKETIKEVKEKTVKAANVSMILQIEGNDYDLSVIRDKAEKAAKKIKASVKKVEIYINITERAAYFTVDGKGSDEQKISF